MESFDIGKILNGEDCDAIRLALNALPMRDGVTSRLQPIPLLKTTAMPDETHWHTYVSNHVDRTPEAYAMLAKLLRTIADDLELTAHDMELRQLEK